MMKSILFLSVIAITNFANCQIDYSKLIIGRTTGIKTLEDGNTTRIFGFAETLGEPIDIPGPTIYMNEGDSIEIDFWNVSQTSPHTIHLHGLDVNQQNDGVPALSFNVGHMEHGFYRFRAPHAGTYIYHCHVVSTIHVQAGMYGTIVVRPPNGDPNLTWVGGEVYNRDFVWTATELDTNWHTDMVLNHDTINPVMVPGDYSPQYYMNNGLSGTQLTNQLNYYTAGINDKVYIRLVNIGYEGVKYIFPAALNARTIESDGRPLPLEIINDTIEVLPGERYGTMIQLGSDPLYPVQMEHFNLNTQEISSTQNVTIRTSAAAIDDQYLEKLVFYPNPSRSGIYYYSTIVDEPFIIFDTRGNKIESSSNDFIDISHAASGVYLLNYKGQVHKLIKD